MLARKKRLIFSLSILLLISLGIFFGGAKFSYQEITQFAEKRGAWAPIVYIFLLTLTYVVAPLSGTPVFLAGFVLFRNKFNYYVFIAHLLSSITNFWIARLWGRNLVIKLVGRKNIEKVDQFTKDYGLKTLVFLRLTLLLAHDFISYASGLTNIKFWPYFLISVLGFLPWFFLWQFYLFKIINSFQEFTLYFFLSLIPLWLVAFFFGLKMRKRRKV